MPRHSPSKIAAALDYLQRLKSQAADFGGGVVDTLSDRAQDVGGLAYEALTSDPNIGRMTTAEFSQAADRPTPRLDQVAQELGTIGKAIVTQPIQTGKALVQGEIERAKGAFDSPRAAGEYAGSMVDPMRLAAALRKTVPVLEMDVYHGTPHRFDPTEENPLGEFDASKIGTGEGAQAYGHGIYLAESPKVARGYATQIPYRNFEKKVSQIYSEHDSPDDAMEALKDAGLSAQELRVVQALQNDDFLGFDYPHQALRAALKEPDNFDLSPETKSAIQDLSPLYKADLPDDMIDRMLDWNKPLIQQPKNVQKAFDDVMTLNGVKSYVPKDTGNKVYFNVGDSQDLMGHQIHDILKKNLGGASESVSRNLKDYGIPGIKYLDAGSRGKSGTGTRNFVVFPGEEKKVRILERDGQKAPPQKIAQALEAAPDYRMGHRPMTVEGGAARLDNAYEAFGEDIYGPNALRYFGGSDPRESGTVAALKRLRDNPDAEVTIYRGVPTDAKGGITKGDWVTLDKSVAQEFAELKPGQKGKVLAIKVKAKDVTTWPDSLLEFGYYPAD